MPISKLVVAHPLGVYDIEVGKPSPNSLKYTEIIERPNGWFEVHTEDSKIVRVINPSFVVEVKTEMITERKSRPVKQLANT